MSTSGSFMTLSSFTGTGSHPGSFPNCSLVQGSDGNFYGNTYSGGTSSFGTVFKYTPLIISGSVGYPINYQIVASNSPTSYFLTYPSTPWFPTGVTLGSTTGLIGGSPTAAGTFSGTINATNSSGTGSAVLTMNVVLTPPVFTSSLTVTGTTNSSFHYQLSAASEITSYAVTGFPSWLTLHTSGGISILTGTPTTTGTYAVAVSAVNASGTTNATLTIGITLPPPRFKPHDPYNPFIQWNRRHPSFRRTGGRERWKPLWSDRGRRQQQ
jgi:uncharacterized repeat protein (TIGR03803 family)